MMSSLSFPLASYIPNLEVKKLATRKSHGKNYDPIPTQAIKGLRSLAGNLVFYHHEAVKRHPNITHKDVSGKANSGCGTCNCYQIMSPNPCGISGDHVGNMVLHATQLKIPLLSSLGGVKAGIVGSQDFHYGLVVKTPSLLQCQSRQNGKRKLSSRLSSDEEPSMHRLSVETDRQT